MKYIFFLFIALAGATSAIGQEYRTDVSIRTQVINGTVPGAKYSTETTTALSHSTKDRNESRGVQIKNNAEPGMKYIKGTESAAGVKPSSSSSAGKKVVASDVKAEPVKVVIPDAPKLPTQQN